MRATGRVWALPSTYHSFANPWPAQPCHPQGSTRWAIEVDGTETEDELAALRSLAPIVVLLNIKDGVSRLHASR